jgi:hypothetical protein
MTKTKFGLDQVNKKTPLWAKWMLGVTIILTTAAAFIVSGDPAIQPTTTVRVLVWLKGVDIVVLGISQLFGIEVKPPTWTGKK